MQQAAARMEDDPHDFGLFPERLIAALRRVEDTYPGMVITHLLFLHYFAKHPGDALSDAYRALGTTSQVASKAFNSLSDIGVPKRPGWKLIEARNDPNDRRVRRIHLTPRGVRFVNDLRRSLEP